MEIPTPSLESVKAAWAWTIGQLELWFRVLRDPAAVLAGIDLNSTSETIAAIQFAVFPIVLSIVLVFPIFLMSEKQSVGVIAFLSSISFSTRLHCLSTWWQL